MKQTIYSHTFPNGLVLVAEPMAGVESAAFSLRLPAGCAYEPADRGGLAGLSCEMALRGSGTRDNRQFVTDLDNLGVERGESVSDAHTSFSGALLGRNLFEALSIYGDLIRQPHFPADELEPSRAVAEQELSAVEDEPAQKVMLELRRRQYPEPWGRPSQGNAQGLESSTLNDVRKFYARQYRPNGAIFGVAGRIDWPVLKDHIARLFGDWQPVVAAEPTEQPTRERIAQLQHESNQTQIGIAYDSAAYRDADYFQAWGSVGVLSGGMSSRLFTEVREKRGLCYSVYAAHSSLRDRGSVMCYAGTSAERAQETLDVTIGELRRLAKGIEAQELDRLKARIKSSLIMQGESSGARASAISRDWYYLGRARTLDEVGKLIDALSRDSINAYLAEHPPQRFTIVTLGPEPLEVARAVS
ncbi:MAG TPA: pitrilysin family protein [Pirellulales bacterium]|nr:pitrilysin family protein [Pirellulales bacterium]